MLKVEDRRKKVKNLGQKKKENKGREKKNIKIIFFKEKTYVKIKILKIYLFKKIKK